MTASEILVLSQLVSRYDERNEPVTPTEIATVTDTDPATVQAFFEDFESKYLLKRAGDGYRPTVTARELLTLGLDDDAAVILDAGPE